MPPDVAKRFIVYAASLGHAITYEDIYGPPLLTHCSSDGKEEGH